MRASLVLPCLAAALSAAAVTPLRAQEPVRDTTRDSARAKRDSTPRFATRFFDSEAPLTITLTSSFERIRRDPVEDPPWRTATITLADSAGAPRTIPLRVRGRGIWRRKNCQMPPLRFNFGRDAVKGTVFEGLDRPKFVNYCQDNDRGEQYVLQELQLYRIYRLLTPMSHKVRLAKVTYVDSASGKERAKRWGFFLEEPDALAEREKGTIAELSLVGPDLHERTRVLVGVFQYLIANADWSTGGLHNAEILARDYVFYPVAYDFDYAGAVNAHYAAPPPNVPIRSVRDRIYRGHCGTDSVFNDVFAEFRQKREAIYALYRDDIGKLLSPAVAKRTLEFFDDFYETIDDPKKARRAIIGACMQAQ